MRILTQPENSDLCGQTCVAMIADADLEAAIKAFGTSGKTSAAQVVKALGAFGVPCAERLVRVKDCAKLPHTCIVKLKIDWHPKPWTHWTLRYQGAFYDPSEFMRTFLSFDGMYHAEHGLKIISCLPLSEQNEGRL